MLSRRGFLSGTLGTGFALAAAPGLASAQACKRRGPVASSKRRFIFGGRILPIDRSQWACSRVYSPGIWMVKN
jgi:hypothetical protein